MAQCITCGTELHPERAKKYNYCMARECQEKNAKGLTMMAIGMNKAAEELMILDERTQADLASGRYHDQRRGSFGTSAPAPAPGTVARDAEPQAGPGHQPPRLRPPAAAAVPAGGGHAVPPRRPRSAVRGPTGRNGSRCSTTSRACGRTRSQPSSASARTWQLRSCSRPVTSGGRRARPCSDLIPASGLVSLRDSRHQRIVHRQGAAVDLPDRCDAVGVGDEGPGERVQAGYAHRGAP